MPTLYSENPFIDRRLAHQNSSIWEIVTIVNKCPHSSQLSEQLQAMESSAKSSLVKLETGHGYFVPGGYLVEFSDKSWAPAAEHIIFARKHQISVAPELVFCKDQSDYSVLITRFPDQPTFLPKSTDSVVLDSTSEAQRESAIKKYARLGFIHQDSSRGSQVITESGAVYFTNWDSVRVIKEEELHAIFEEAILSHRQLHIPFSFQLNGEVFNSHVGFLNAIRFHPEDPHRKMAAQGEHDDTIFFQVDKDNIYLFGLGISPLSDDWMVILGMLKNLEENKDNSSINITENSLRLGRCSNFANTPFEIESSDPRDSKSFASVAAFMQYIKINPEDQTVDREKLTGLSGSAVRQARDGINKIIFGRSRNQETMEVYWNGESIPYQSEAHYELIASAIDAKLVQHPDALRALLSTYDRPLSHDLGNGSAESESLSGKKFVEILTRIRNSCIEAKWGDFTITKYSELEG